MYTLKNPIRLDLSDCEPNLQYLKDTEQTLVSAKYAEHLISVIGQLQTDLIHFVRDNERVVLLPSYQAAEKVLRDAY